jgi:tripartite-type tricarboxylate transporter receptor subunit TctC
MHARKNQFREQPLVDTWLREARRAGPERPLKHLSRRRVPVWITGLALLTSMAASPGHAQSPAQVPAAAYPTRPITLVVPYPAGGVVDLVARAVTERMARSIGQPIVVEARPGASANIGTAQVLKAPADGYTILMGAPFLATNPLLMTGTTWKTSDFTGLGLIGAPPNLFVVANQLPVKDLKDFVTYVKARPGKLNVSNPGTGTSNHLGQELFFSLTGLQMQDVHYKGQPQMLPDIASGQVSFGVVTLALAAPQIAEGRFRALAISAPRRSPQLPEVPTLAEAGFGEATFLPWYGMVALRGTPPEAIRKLSDEIMAALKDPAVVARLEKMGALVTPEPAAAFDRLLTQEAERWTRVIRDRKLEAR